AASSFRKSSESDTLELQKATFVLDAEVAVCAESVRSDDSVARQDQRVPVVRAERPGRALRIGVPGRAGQLAVGHNLAVRHVAKGVCNVALKQAQPVEVELHVVEPEGLACEIAAEPVDESAHIRCRYVTAVSGFRRYRRSQREAGV